jgi:hypothetical protein
MAEIKRLNYFRHQFLDEKDFQDEQKYHIEMRRLLNRLLHSEGIVDGLNVERADDQEIRISPGMALDREGREIILARETTRNLESIAAGSHGFVTISYNEQMEQADRYSGGGVEGFTRVTESHEIHVTPQHPPEDSTAIVLARVHLNEARHIREIDHSVRRHSAPRLGPGAIREEYLANGAVTAAKLAPALRRQTGWLRLSFKPHPEPERPAFAIGPTEALCGREGATGNMGIPSPPGAVRITGFRIAGEINDAGITIELYKCGWDPVGRDHEKRTLLKNTFQARRASGNRSPFEEMVPLEEDLDPEHHALSVRVIGAGRTSISLIAIRFEYELREATEAA